MKVNCVKILEENITLENYNVKNHIKVDKNLTLDGFEKNDKGIFKNISYYYRQITKSEKTFINVDNLTFFHMGNLALNYVKDFDEITEIDLNFDIDVIKALLILIKTTSFSEVKTIALNKNYKQIYNNYIFDKIEYFKNPNFIERKKYYIFLNKMYELCDFLDSEYYCEIIRTEMDEIRDYYLENNYIIHNGLIVSYIHSLMEIYPDLTELQSKEIEEKMFDFFL
jgi:hypothetical protein